MGATFSRIKTWISGETLTHTDLNTEFDNILNNLDPAGIDDCSSDAAAMQANSDPYPGATISLATDLVGELQRLRYQFRKVTQNYYWYQDPVHLRGLAIRSKFERSGTSEITIHPGVYEIKNKIVSITSDVTSAISSTTNDDWYFLYIDNSSLSGSEGNATSGNFIWANTAPSYATTRHGWYNSSDRCIFAVYFSAGHEIRPFHHDGGDYVQFDQSTTDLDWTDVDLAYQDVTLSIPDFIRKAQITLGLRWNDDQVSTVIQTVKPKGSTAAGGSGHEFCRVTSDTDQVQNTVTFLCTTTNVISLVHTTSGAAKSAVWTEGWYFPENM